MSRYKFSPEDCRNRYYPVDVERLKHYRDKGWSYKRISVKLGINEDKVYRELRKLTTKTSSTN